MARADWLVKLRISCAIYLRVTREKMACGLHPRKVKKSSKLICFWCLLGTFRSEDEDDCEYEFSVLSMRIGFGLKTIQWIKSRNCDLIGNT